MKSDGDAEIAAMMRLDLGLEKEEAQRPPVDCPDRPYLDAMVRRLESLLARLRTLLKSGAADAAEDEVRWYGNLMIAALYFRWFTDSRIVDQAEGGTQPIAAFREFARQCQTWNDIPIRLEPFFADPAHMFAVAFQLRLAFVLIPQRIQGNSRPVRRLREAIWNSIFPHELRLYGSLLYNRMQDVTTLILGPSGTGKELVATAIGQSRYVPFDARSRRFREPFAGAFHALNLSAMPRELIESEMFGHCAGAFTGAARDRLGWFEKCARGHTVFLDEIGELAESVQVKLLRVLQTREFYRVGETEPRRFEGKVIAATNRDLSAEIQAGRFREDLFYRLCSDVIRTPSLREQLDDSPGDLPVLLQLVAARCLGEQALPEHVSWLTNLTLQWIERSPEIGALYPWPGNFRELEQCVRNVMVRGEYHPPLVPRRASTGPSAASFAPAESGNSALDRFVAQIRGGALSYDELLEQYCSLVFSRSANLTETARRLGKHRATIQSRIVADLVERFRER